MIGYYVTDIDGRAILGDTIFLEYNEAALAKEHYYAMGIRTVLKNIKVQGTELAVGNIVDGDVYDRDPEGMNKYLKQSMASEFSKKLNIRFEHVRELDTHIGPHTDYHFRGSIELPKEYIKDGK